LKPLFLLLLIANAAFAAWLAFGEPVDTVREPGRVGLQIAPERFRTLSDSQLAELRGQAERAATAKAAAASAAAAAAASAAAAAAELPSASCVEIGDFPSDSAAKKARTRIAALGLGDHIVRIEHEHTYRLRVTGVDTAIEVKLHALMKDFPGQTLSHCAETAAAPETSQGAT
jgi:3-oxoacyl-ACP reductase-like protein